MAMQNRYTPPTPDWMRVEIGMNELLFGESVRIGFVCRDGFATIVLDDIYPSVGTKTKDISLAQTKHEVLRRIMDHVAKQLATLELEKE